MQIKYSQILTKNMINVFKDVLREINKGGITSAHNLYINFKTNDPKTKIPKWLKEKYPEEMTIILEHEFWDLKIKKNSFTVILSFNDVKSDLEIDYYNIISFADPFANFGLRLMQEDKIKKNKKQEKINFNKKKYPNKTIDNNIIDFKKYKKT